MRYFFHLESETNIHIDHLGEEFAREEDVMEHAFAMARELAGEDRWLGWSLRVIDERNTEILCVPILDSIMSR